MDPEDFKDLDEPQIKSNIFTNTSQHLLNSLNAQDYEEEANKPCLILSTSDKINYKEPNSAPRTLLKLQPNGGEENECPVPVDEQWFENEGEFAEGANSSSSRSKGTQNFECEICGKKLSENKHLKRHMLVHTGEQPFSCKDCPKRFALNSSLIRHTEQVHMSQKLFPCQICSKFFKRNHDLQRHKKVHEEEDPFLDTRRGKFICKICGKKFNKEARFEKHEEAHEFDILRKKPKERVSGGTASTNTSLPDQFHGVQMPSVSLPTTANHEELNQLADEDFPLLSLGISSSRSEILAWNNAGVSIEDLGVATTSEYYQNPVSFSRVSNSGSPMAPSTELDILAPSDTLAGSDDGVNFEDVDGRTTATTSECHKAPIRFLGSKGVPSEQPVSCSHVPSDDPIAQWLRDNGM